ncbi:MAG: 16S rRNA (uracil(1498)-N(3))-methyltransferase [Bacilli bacterium]|nr:16S rRNA (uracil(1498)-N(3))-methyltransferase [Bacilli bacterium]
MDMQHYFINEKHENLMIFSNDDAHHILNVMRLRNNDQVVCIFENSKYLCELVIENKSVKAKIVEEIEDNSILPIKVVLFYSMPKGEKFELVLQKATELGVTEIIPVMTRKCIVSIDSKKLPNKMERWNKILKEASEQSRRSTIPLLREPINKEQVKEYMCETNLIGDERKVVEGTSSMMNLVNNAKSISVLVGCEGGFTNDEFDYFKSIGFEGVSFGKRILRSETAAIYALSCIMFMLESRK